MGENEHVLRPTDKIYDLVDVIDDKNDLVVGKAKEVIPAEVPVCEQVQSMIGGIDPELNVRIIEKVSEIVEKVAREIMPDIAERVIKEEIENLKKEYDQGEI